MKIHALAGLLPIVLAPFLPAAIRAQVKRSDNGSATVYPIDPEAAPRPTLRALEITDAIRIDGRLDEPVWLRADSATDFITGLPRAGYPAQERTVARVLLDGATLYVGAYLYDAEPQRLYSPGLEQDFETHDADLFGVVFDAFLDRQNGIMFGVSPAGALFDAQSFNDSREVNRAWEGVIELKTLIHADGWSVEMAIPLRTLRFRADAGEQAWGLNFLRRIRRLNEDSYWAPLQRQFRVHKMSRAGTLTGLRALQQGRNLGVKPYLKAANMGGALPRQLGDAGGHLEAGFDLKYGISSRLTADVTAFTDFSQVEVDQEQVNLTRFSLFFPEKRDFFLENDGTFTFGDVTERNYRTGSGPTDFKLFYSRSIGLSQDRRPIPILGGVRVSGRAGATEIGLLDMQTRAQTGAPAENFAVLRLRQNFGPAADVGVLIINRQAERDPAVSAYNRALGFDANLRILRYLIVNAYAAGTDEPNATGDRSARYLQIAWRDPLLDVSAFAKHVGDGFHPEVGFIRRTGIRQLFGTLGAHPQPRLPTVAELNPFVDVSGIENLDGVLETRWVKPGMIATFRDGGLFEVNYEDRFERLFEPTPIAGATVPAGDYQFAAFSADYQSNGARRLSGSVGLAHGDFYDGKRTSVNARLAYRPNPRIVAEAFVERNDVQLVGENRAADVFGGRIRYSASTRLFASAFVQYLEASNELVSNLRFNFIHAPLSDIFLVLTERRALDGGVSERVVTIKASKLLSF
ncbi:MAG: DUF5916 domain-containing protein [Longimicrobiales bacterium]